MPDYSEPNGSIASAIVDAMETIDYMIDQLRQADEMKEVMLVSQFAGQVKGLLNQWREVDQYFQCRYGEHPLTKKYIPNVLLIS